MRSKVILTLAIVMGLVTTLLFYKYMNEMDQTAVVNEEVVNVIVAKQEIKKNQLISSAMMEQQQIPKSGLLQGTLSDQSLALGKVAKADIALGEPLLQSLLADTEEESLFITRKIKEGYRAISIGVNFVQSVSNLIEPDDAVDVIVSIKDETTKEIKTQLILQKIKVLAVGRRMIETVQGAEYVEYTSVTLELNSQDTVKLVDAAAREDLTMTLYTRLIPSDQPIYKEGSSNGK